MLEIGAASCTETELILKSRRSCQDGRTRVHVHISERGRRLDLAVSQPRPAGGANQSSEDLMRPTDVALTLLSLVCHP
jgi:hypothetical protein